ncbi:MAG TPA: penicillin-binding protein 2 [Aestuariivirgaceae bacterium]|nr:penicillin-binding protein 2 [Aestuariivirgaceae bacterium]
MTVQVSALAGQKRLRLVVCGFALCFAIIALRFAQLALLPPHAGQAQGEREAPLLRPDIIDRNGVLLASDIAIPSLYADPRQIIDADEAVELLTGAIPEMSARDIMQRLSQKRSFVWLKRQITPRQKEIVHRLGIPGVGFRNETRRVYPMGRLGAHVLGYVDVDSHGLAGIEKYLDERGAIYKASLAEPGGNNTGPAELAIDARVQHAVASEIAAAMATYKAQAGAGIVLDVKSGEVIAAVSLPDFNPNDPKQAQDKESMNRFSGGVFELGSSVKTVTFAMALDEGVADLGKTYDCRYPLPAGRSRIDDYHATRRILTVPEIFTHSSNIGTAKMALDVGVEGHKQFLRKLGLFDRLHTELPESAEPLYPARWSRVNTMTAAFGHGISIQPLQLASAVAAFVNGGIMIEPTFFKRDAAEAGAASRRVISEETSVTMRYLMRLNVTEGTATKAEAPGYRVGGKTGSAEKVVGGRYSRDHRLTTFVGAFPMDNPRYAVLVLLDEPQAVAGTYGFATAGWNAVPTAGRIIARVGSMLGVAPEITAEEAVKLAKKTDAGTIGD